MLPLAMAHRGFSLDGLENSMAAFRAAVDLGFRHLETDVHTTADGVLLLFHDETLDRITAERGRIADLPAATVARARIGGTEPIPQLAELVQAYPGRPAQPRRQGLEFRCRAGLGDRTLRRCMTGCWLPVSRTGGAGPCCGS